MSTEIKNSLMDPVVQHCPWSHYKELHQHAPVYRMPEPDMYIISKYDLLREVITQPKLFSSMAPPGSESALNRSDEADRIVREEGFGRSTPSLQNCDEPAHSMYRDLVNVAFRPKRVREMGDYIDTVISDEIDRFREAGQCDGVADLAVPVPLKVIADQIGIPRDNYITFKAWCDAWLIGLGLLGPEEEEIVAAARLVVEMQHYLIERARERQVDPLDDILSDVANAKVEGGRSLTDQEILSVIEQILVAGNETTTNGIAAGLFHLTRDKALQKRLRERPEDIKKFVEEVLRFESPVTGLFRWATEDTELDGHRIAKGMRLMLVYAAANHDESKFPLSDEFDIDRANVGAHVAFGSGIHHCVGSELARVEMRAAFGAMLTSFSDIDLAIKHDEVRHHPSFALRGIVSLPLTLKV